MDVDLTPALRVAAWQGRPVSDDASDALSRYGSWLVAEAIPAGGLGPREADRVGTRHLADSVAFGAAWRGKPAPERILDLGSGVGLPGIPLAILHPHAEVTLVDRSGARCRLARRAIRVCGLDNVSVIQSDIAGIGEQRPAVVSRASLPPPQLLPHLRRLVAPGGIGVVGGPRKPQPVEPGYEVLRIPPEVLDPGPRLLIMAPS